MESISNEDIQVSTERNAYSLDYDDAQSEDKNEHVVNELDQNDINVLGLEPEALKEKEFFEPMLEEEPEQKEDIFEPMLEKETKPEQKEDILEPKSEQNETNQPECVDSNVPIPKKRTLIEFIYSLFYVKCN